jgi:ATP-dependent Clp endopeptidase proteolytic subunit ClpP
MGKWYDIKDKGEKAELWIYEEIGEDFWTGGGVTAKNFQKELSALKVSQIDMHINSPGGAVFDGITIHNLVKQHPANVTTYIDGLAASIASVIALAGDQVIMAENALWMMHNPSGVVYGDSNDMRSMADVLDKVRESLIQTYSSKSGKSESDIIVLLDAETWMTAEEAMEAGFVDQMGAEMDLAACARFIPVMAKAGYKHIPENILANREMPSERIMERALRDVGCSSKQAREILAKGYSEGLRDEGPVKTQRDVVIAHDKVKPSSRISSLLIRAERLAPKKS